MNEWCGFGGPHEWHQWKRDDELFTCDGRSRAEPRWSTDPKPCHIRHAHGQHSYILAREHFRCPGKRGDEHKDMYYDPATGLIGTHNYEGCIVLPGGRVPKELFPALFATIEGAVDG